MTPDSQITNLTLQVDAGEDSDAEEIQQLAYQLYAELQDLDIESADFVREEPLSEGAKGVPFSPEIAVSALIPVAIEVIKMSYQWVKRREDLQIVLKSQVGERIIELVITSKGYQTNEVEQFIDILTRSMGENAKSK